LTTRIANGGFAVSGFLSGFTLSASGKLSKAD
jgi:hypothetical protein